MNLSRPTILSNAQKIYFHSGVRQLRPLRTKISCRPILSLEVIFHIERMNDNTFVGLSEISCIKFSDVSLYIPAYTKSRGTLPVFLVVLKVQPHEKCSAVNRTAVRWCHLLYIVLSSVLLLNNAIAGNYSPKAK